MAKFFMTTISSISYLIWNNRLQLYCILLKMINIYHYSIKKKYTIFQFIIHLKMFMVCHPSKSFAAQWISERRRQLLDHKIEQREFPNSSMQMKWIPQLFNPFPSFELRSAISRVASYPILSQKRSESGIKIEANPNGSYLHSSKTKRC